jgi:hypothetical protein
MFKKIKFLHKSNLWRNVIMKLGNEMYLQSIKISHGFKARYVSESLRGLKIEEVSYGFVRKYC